MWPRSQTMDEAEYKALHVQDIETGDDQVEHHAWKQATGGISVKIPKSVRILGQLLVLGLTLWGVANLGRRTFNVSIVRSGPPSCSCGGSTSAEAIKRGCIFTPMAVAWLPPQCLDMELSAEFDEAGPDGKWHYWKDANGTVFMSWEEMAMLPDSDGVFYTTQEWHIAHCMFAWRKHYRSQLTGTVIEARSNGIRHIAHCEGIMKMEQPLDALRTRAGTELNADLV